MQKVQSQLVVGPVRFERRRQARFVVSVWIAVIASAVILVAALLVKLREMPGVSNSNEQNGGTNDSWSVPDP